MHPETNAPPRKADADADANLPIKPIKISDILAELERRAPAGTAEDWDNVGLLAGDPDWETARAIVCVDLTARAIEQAKATGARVIINHHPCVFPKNRGLPRVTSSGQGGVTRWVFEALRQGIAVIACHTNFDRCALEVVERVSEGLGFIARGRLLDHPAGSLRKLVVFVPATHAEAVRGAVCAAGAGRIGRYDQCAFHAEGEGTFRGDGGTRPFLGNPGVLERAKEVRLETIFPAGLEREVIAALRASHPYEEIAYDILAVEQAPPSTGVIRGLGYGFWGDGPAGAASKLFSDCANDVKSLFNLDGFWLTRPARLARDDAGWEIRRVAFVAGKGASFVAAAAAQGCDLLITGEVGYHMALDAAQRGLGVLELGHRESERFFLQVMAEWMESLGLRTQALDEPIQEFWTARSKETTT